MNPEVANKMRGNIKRHEGYRQFPYVCSEGFLTIGYGHNLTTNGCNLVIANFWMEEDIKDATNDLFHYLPFTKELDEVTQAVLIEMTYNLGILHVLQFRKMIDALRTNDRATATKEMLDSKWHKQCGNRVDEMAYWMETGKM